VSDIIVGESNDLSYGQIALIEQLRQNPVVAAKVLLGVDLHWYQIETIEDFFLNNKRFALLKWSRQLGKCECCNSLILIKIQRKNIYKKEIKYIRIEDLYYLTKNNKDIEKISILTLNQDTYKFEETDNFTITYNGKKTCLKVKTATGRDNTLTENHPLMTISGWKKVETIEIGTNIAVPRIISLFNDQDTEDDNKIKILAYLIGDGYGCVRTYGDDNKRKKDREFVLFSNIIEYKNCITNLFGEQYDFSIDRDINHLLHNGNNWNSIRNFLDNYGIRNKLSYDKRVPEQIFGTSKRQIALFLSRLFATDGWACICNKKNTSNYSKERQSIEIGYCSVNERLVKDVQHLLLRFGIISSYKKKPVDYTKKNREQSIVYQLYIDDSRSVITFCDEIGIFGKEEAVKACRTLAESKDNNRDIIPIEIWEYIRKKVNEKLTIEKEKQKKWLKESGIKIPRNEKISLRKWDKEGKIRRKELTPLYPYAPQRDKVLKYAEFLNDDYLKFLATSDLYWDEVVSIEYDGVHDTYDLSVPGPDNGGKNSKYRNFICDDILVHNTFLESIIIGLQCILYPDEVGIFLAPSQRQSLNPMNNLLRCYNSSNIFQSLISKKNKGFIRFKNGSEITSLPQGDGSKILGQHATIVGIDEYARFTREYITTIILPMLNQPGANGLPNTLVTLSTPLSKQNHFYKWYLTHKKYSVQPNSLYHLSEYDYRDSNTIDLNIIQMSLENSSWEQFARENLGIFTDNIDGFFSNELIYSCVEEEDETIKIQNVPESTDAKYVLGIDPSNLVMKDRFAIYLYQIIDLEGSVLGVKFANAWTFDKGTIPDLEKLIVRIMRVFPVIRAHIDHGGGGRQIAEHLMEPAKYYDNILNEDIEWDGCANADINDKTPQRGGKETPIKIIPYSSEKKNRMFFNLKNVMTTGRFKIPKNNLHDKSYIESNLLKDELENIMSKTLPNNLLTFDHPDNVGDDRVNASALAIDAFWDAFYGQTESSATMVRGIDRRVDYGIGDISRSRDFTYTERNYRF
jgi:intein/homing endonuclease